jgi:hypothetical protein
MVQPIIHIGYNKTGSTWLQDEVFPKRELGYLSFLSIEDRTAVYRSIVKQHALHFDGAPILEYYRSKVEDPKNQGLVPVFSAERFSGDPHSAGYDTKEIAWRLKELFPGGKVIMVIREQRSMLLSTYKQYVRAGGPRSMKHYFHPPERGSRRMPMFSFEYFEYDPLIRYYQELFGKDNLLVLPFEWLRKAPQKFIKEILTFSGLAASDEVLKQLPFQKKVNRGYGPVTLRLKRPLNRFCIDNTLNPGALFSLPYSAERRIVELLKRLDSLLPKAVTERSQKKMKNRIREEVGERYRESNRRVEALTGLDLGSLGYDI